MTLPRFAQVSLLDRFDAQCRPATAPTQRRPPASPPHHPASTLPTHPQTTPIFRCRPPASHFLLLPALVPDALRIEKKNKDVAPCYAVHCTLQRSNWQGKKSQKFKTLAERIEPWHVSMLRELKSRPSTSPTHPGHVYKLVGPMVSKRCEM